MNDDSNKRIRIGVIVAASIMLAILAWFWASAHPPFAPSLTEPRPPPQREIPGDIELYYTLNSVFSTLNATLLVSLLILYVKIYVKRKIEFTLWLAIFCSVLLLDALTSNPIVQWVFGFRPFGLGPFAMLPDLFTFVASIILLYLTIRY